MKSLFLSLIFLTLFWDCFSQEKKSIVDTTKIWSTAYKFSGQGTYSFWTESYKFGRDTVIKDHAYKKILVCYDSLLTHWSFMGKYIREDANKVYLFSNDQENLLYDFNLKIGDFFFNSKVLGSIDTIIINDVSRRQFVFVNEGDSIIWIEGIGSLSGLFEPLKPRFKSIGAYATTCVTENQIEIYHSPYISPCFIYYNWPYTDIANNLYKREKIEIALLGTNLKIETEMLSYNLFLLDLNGRIIKGGRYSGNEMIDCSALKSGIYLVKVVGDKSKFIKKIVSVN